MRVATFNIMHGRSLADMRVDAPRLRDAIAGLGADLLALQEVDQYQPRSGGIDLAAVAAQGMGVPADRYRFAAAVVGSPETSFRRPDSDDDGAGDGSPRYGVALYSRFPVLAWHTLRLRAARVPGPVLLPGPGGRGRLILLRDEPRVAVAATVATPGGPLTVAGTHLSFVAGWNLAQLRQVVRWLRGLPAPRLLLGDLNQPAAVAELLSGWRVAARAATYPAGNPRVQLDHILLDAGPGGVAAPVPGEARTPVPDVSDHRPLVVEFRAGPDAPIGR